MADGVFIDQDETAYRQARIEIRQRCGFRDCIPRIEMHEREATKPGEREALRNIRDVDKDGWIILVLLSNERCVGVVLLADAHCSDACERIDQMIVCRSDERVNEARSYTIRDTRR
jgi:hypothetical protein